MEKDAPTSASPEGRAARHACPKGKRLIGGGAVVAPVPVPWLSVNGPDGRRVDGVAYATAPTGNWQLVNMAICG